MGHIVKCILIMISLGACNPPIAEPLNQQPRQPVENSALPGLERQLEISLAEELGRPVSIAIDQAKTVDHWQFVCGRPLETDGRPFDYANSRLSTLSAEQLIDDYFCGLFERTAGGPQLRELAVATTDAPIVDWIETYSLPADLFAE